jgi:hypothetical protein
MAAQNLWEAAELLPIRTGSEIVGGFDVGFDSQVPEEIKNTLMDFVYWVEDHYSLPITLWIDFKYRHYLVDQNKKRVGYKFYWVDFCDYPNFDNFDDIPVIELAVRTEKSSVDTILLALIEAISHYFAYLSRHDMNTFRPEEGLTREIFASYKESKGV